MVSGKDRKKTVGKALLNGNQYAIDSSLLGIAWVTWSNAVSLTALSTKDSFQSEKKLRIDLPLRSQPWLIGDVGIWAMQGSIVGCKMVE